jgi:holliday junction DNA helicase RuvA
MIGHLRGSIHRLDVGEVHVDVQGVGYRVQVPLETWERLPEGEMAMVWVSTYVREDRLDFFGFADRSGRTLFEEFLKLDGVGPKLALELCSVPRSMLHQAATQKDPSILTDVKGVGKKTAEKILIELTSLLERKPDILGSISSDGSVRPEFDKDAVATLASLGYDNSSILAVLRELPADLASTEERVAAALRSL